MPHTDYDFLDTYHVWDNQKRSLLHPSVDFLMNTVSAQLLWSLCPLQAFAETE